MSNLEKISTAIVSLATVGAFAAYSSAAMELKARGGVRAEALADLPTPKAAVPQATDPAARPLETRPKPVVAAPEPPRPAVAPEPSPVPLVRKIEPVSPPTKNSVRPHAKSVVPEKTVAAATPEPVPTTLPQPPAAPTDSTAVPSESTVPPAAKAEPEATPPSTGGAPSPAAEAAASDGANSKHRRSKSGSEADASPGDTGSRDEWGTLALRANAGGDAFVDGKKVKKTQWAAFKVSPGNHTVRFDCVSPDGSKKAGADKAVDVLPYSEVSVDFECTDQNAEKAGAPPASP